MRTARYRKSSRSSGAQECVAIGHANGCTGIQDTKQAAGSESEGVLALPNRPFDEFLSAIKNGRYDQ
ncbi:MAG: DUF397 domain-containing protein [Labedaea sp.]